MANFIKGFKIKFTYLFNQNIPKKLLMKQIYILILLLLISVFSNAQQAKIKGVVSDLNTQQIVDFAVVSLDKTKQIYTDSLGAFSFVTSAGKHVLKVSRVGYRTLFLNIDLDEGANKNIQIDLEPFNNQMDQIVIAGSREGKKVAKEIASVSIIKPYLIDNTNSTDLSQVINRLPGVQVADGQASIRGGVGYSYNTGSKIAVLLDDMPLMGADLGDVRWKFLPIEAAEQVEVIKGSASVLYGSAALNGTINVRTGWPTKTPKTKIQAYQGIMQNYDRSAINWWEAATQPFNNGMFFTHKQMFGNFDLVLSGNISSMRSHLQYADEFRARTYVKTRYRPEWNKKITFGVNGSLMYEKSGRFFLWANADSGTLKQFNGSKPIDDLYRIFTIDPHFDYDGLKMHHAVKFRMYQITRLLDKTRFPNESDAVANLYAFDYNNKYKIDKHFALNSGVYITSMFSNGNVYKGQFGGGTGAVYSQLDYTYKRLIITGGMRYEMIAQDTSKIEKALLKRIGLNYQAAKKTYLRANYSEGYRVPTIGEKFVEDKVSFLNVLPNPSLIPEKGWTAEIGIQQGFKIAGFLASADFAIFVQDYDSMIDFRFGQYNKPTIENPDPMIGFKAFNVGHVRAGGVDFSLQGEGKIKDVMIRILTGYTYSLPVNMSTDESLKDYGNYTKLFFESLGKSKAEDGSYLKKVIMPYRNRTTAKFDLDLAYRKLTFGYSIFYYSVYEKVDDFVLLLPGVKTFFSNAGNADVIHNIRVGLKPTKNYSVGLLVNNLTNREYATRPGKLDPARTLVIQLLVNF
jgi:outer membrane receptor protein involved in Fe transport